MNVRFKHFWWYAMGVLSFYHYKVYPALPVLLKPISDIQLQSKLGYIKQILI